PPEIYPLSLHDALPISRSAKRRLERRCFTPSPLPRRPGRGGGVRRPRRANPPSAARFDRSPTMDRMRPLSAVLLIQLGSPDAPTDRKSTRLNSSHVSIS